MSSKKRAEDTDSPEDVEAAWRSELVERVRRIKDGSATLYDGEQVDRELAKILEEA